MTAIEKLLKIAKAEVGYIEKASNKDLYDKIANTSTDVDKNYTKYAYETDTKYSGFYNGKKNGQAWCDVFTDWCFVTAFGVENAKKMLCQPSASAGAGCKYSMNYYKSAGKLYGTPKVGDQIFFYNSKKSNIAHTGIVCKVDDTHVYTIEGNTRPDPYVVSNGGMVCEKCYLLSNGDIAGYGRPDYSIIKEETPKVIITVKEWQKAAMADGFEFPKYGADGKWGSECAGVAKKAVVKKQLIGYKYPNLTKIVQRVVGVTVDGMCGKDTKKAIMAYQESVGFSKKDGEVDGCAGLNTWKKILGVKG